MFVYIYVTCIWITVSINNSIKFSPLHVDLHATIVFKHLALTVVSTHYNLNLTSI